MNTVAQAEAILEDIQREQSTLELAGLCLVGGPLIFLAGLALVGIACWENTIGKLVGQERTDT